MQYGITPNLEFMFWTAVKGLADAAEVLRAVDHPNIGLLLDTLHFGRSASRIEVIAGLPPGVVPLCPDL